MFHQHGRYDFGVQPVYFGYTPAFDFESTPSVEALIAAEGGAGITDADLNPTDIFNKMDSILSKARKEGEKRNKGANYYELKITHSSMLKSIKNAAVDPIKAATDMITKMNTYMSKHWKDVAPTAVKEYSNLLNGLDLDAVETKATPVQLESVELLKNAVAEGKAIVQPWYVTPLTIGGIALLIGVPLYLVMRKR